MGYFTIPNSSYSNITTNATVYLPAIGQNTVNNVVAATATEVNIRIPPGISGTIDQLYVKSNANLSGGSATITLMINSIATSVTCTIANGTSTASDTSNSAILQEGNAYCLKIVSNGAATFNLQGYSLRFFAHQKGFYLVGGSGGSAAGTAGSSIAYWNYFKSPGLTADTTIGNRDNIVPHSATIRAISFRLTGPGQLPAGDSLIFQLYKNGSAVAGTTATLDGTDGGGTPTADVSALNISITTGDNLSYGLRIDPFDSLSGPSYIQCTLIESAVDGDFWVGGSSTSDLDNTNIRYAPLDTCEEAWRTTEIRTQYCGTAFTLSKLRIELTGSPGSGNSYAFITRINGADGALTATVADLNTTASDNTNSDSIASTDTLLLKVTPSSTPTVRDADWCAVGTISTTPGDMMKINIGDTWKTITAIKINIGDSWKNVVSVKIRLDSFWVTKYYAYI